MISNTIARIVVFLFLLALETASYSVPANPVPSISVGPAERTLHIDGVIAAGNLEGLGKALVQMAKSDTNSPIDLIINSPGGEVLTGRLFISYMLEARRLGASIRCFVPQFAASMAFSILLYCTERHAVVNSFLLWHRVRTGVRGVLTAPDAEALAEDLRNADQIVVDELEKYMTIPTDVIMHHFNRETLHQAGQLHALDPDFLTVHGSIAGLQDAMSSPKVMRSRMPSMFDRMARLIYIYTGNGT